MNNSQLIKSASQLCKLSADAGYLSRAMAALKGKSPESSADIYMPSLHDQPKIDDDRGLAAWFTPEKKYDIHNVGYTSNVSSRSDNSGDYGIHNRRSTGMLDDVRHKIESLGGSPVDPKNNLMLRLSNSGLLGPAAIAALAAGGYGGYKAYNWLAGGKKKKTETPEDN